MVITYFSFWPVQLCLCEKRTKPRLCNENKQLSQIIQSAQIIPALHPVEHNDSKVVPTLKSNVHRLVKESTAVLGWRNVTFDESEQTNHNQPPHLENSYIISVSFNLEDDVHCFYTFYFTSSPFHSVMISELWKQLQSATLSLTNDTWSPQQPNNVGQPGAKSAQWQQINS